MPSHVTIRLATVADFSGIRSVLDTCELWPRLAGVDFSGLVLVAEDAGQIVGAAQAITGKPTGFLTFLAVLPAYRKTGLAAQFNDSLTLAATLLGMPVLTAITDATNAAWGDTLDRYGFTTVLPNARLHRKG